MSIDIRLTDGGGGGVEPVEVPDVRSGGGVPNNFRLGFCRLAVGGGGDGLADFGVMGSGVSSSFLQRINIEKMLYSFYLNIISYLKKLLKVE